MAALTEKHREFLANPFVGTVTTLRPDGSAHNTVVWVDVDEHGASFNTAHGRRKPRNLARDPRLTLTVIDPQNAYRWLSITGTATLTDEGAEDQIDRLAQKYIGQFPYPWRKPGERRVSVRIEPQRIEAVGLD